MQITQTNQSNAESAANLKGRRKGSKLNLMNASDDNLDKNLEYWQKEYMMQWFEQYKHNGYPSESEKLRIAKHLGLHKKKISNWFINIHISWLKTLIILLIIGYKTTLMAIKTTLMAIKIILMAIKITLMAIKATLMAIKIILMAIKTTLMSFLCI